MLFDLQAGIENLSTRLNGIEVGTKVDFKDGKENFAQGLEKANLKMKILYSALKENPAVFKEAMEHVRTGGSMPV